MKDQHYSLYTMNRHRETLDIHDTRRYIGPVDQTTRWHKSEYHSDRTEMVKNFLFHLSFFSCVRVLNNICCDVYFYFIFIFHQMIRMTGLLKKVYGEKEYKRKESVDWVDVSKKASFLGAPE